MSKVNAGDELIVPLYEPSPDNKPVKVTWQQDGSTRTAEYFALSAANVTLGEQVPFFIAAEFYKSSMVANANHITKVAQLIEGEGYKLKVDGRLQYGQKSAAGDLRFVVFHDKGCKPYQHRFIETALGSLAGKKASTLASAFNVGGQGTADSIHNIAKNYVGDYLRTF